ncbi:MAG TPA: DUF2867 domain-containing protein [Streptosporangiaceae bacterium]|nr:DUF2867 domain-containing protein [Streptosporangiaceae bacterium]
MRLPDAEHAAHPWVIAQIAPDFELIDAWALPAQGGRDDFGALLEVVAAVDGASAESALTRALFRVRYQLGAWFGWDDAARRLPVPGCTETTLSQRLPVNLRGSATGLDLSPAGFTPLYRTRDEWAAELSNGTVHAVLHLAWVEQGNGRHRGQMGIYVKPRGRLGATYMTLIRPFRHRIVYPALMRQIGRAWQARPA